MIGKQNKTKQKKSSEIYNILTYENPLHHSNNVKQPLNQSCTYFLSLPYTPNLEKIL